MSNLAGKVAVVTGASKGIGASIAEHLAAVERLSKANFKDTGIYLEKFVAVGRHIAFADASPSLATAAHEAVVAALRRAERQAVRGRVGDARPNIRAVTESAAGDAEVRTGRRAQRVGEAILVSAVDEAVAIIVDAVVAELATRRGAAARRARASARRGAAACKRADSTAARIMAAPPWAWTFMMETPSCAAARQAPATVLGMS